jgi:hypothetical protein
MGRQIIKQPNGKFCIFSSIVDSITYYNMEEKDIADLWVNEERENIEKRVKENIEKLNNGTKPYGHFTKSYSEVLALIKEVLGEKEALNVKSSIEG